MTATPVQGRTADDSFEGFYGRNGGALRAYMSRQVRGRVELDDAMQEGLIRISCGFDEWPPEHRLRYAKRALRCAAYDGMRRQLGSHTRPHVLLSDFTDEGRGQDASTTCIARALYGLARDRATAHGELVERDALLEAFGALTPEEARVLLGILHLGDTRPQMAARLGLSPGRVAYVYDEARSLVRSLLSHERGDGLSSLERRALIDLKAGRLAHRERRRTRRHLEHCPTCRSIEVLEPGDARLGTYTGPERRG
jgi:DNA-directed RNA polymerase specialized sigma24 family protein